MSLVMGSCIMERVKGLAGNEIELLMEIPTIESRASNILLRLQHIYNFLLFHAIIVSILDVLYATLCNYISFFETNL